MIVAEIHKRRLAIYLEDAFSSTHIGTFFGEIRQMYNDIGQIFIVVADGPTSNVFIYADAIRKGDQ